MGEYLDRSEITFLPQEYFTDNKTGGRRAIDILVQVKFRGEDTCFLIHVENVRRESRAYGAYAQ